jgi:hypothetical protein
MKKSHHILFAFILNFIFVFATIYFGLNLFKISFLSITLISLIIVFYSLLPDIDHKNSTITWFFFGIGILGLIFGIIQLIIKSTNPNPLAVLIISTLFLIVTFLSANFLEHRGIIHTVWIGILAVIPLFLVFHSFFYCIIAYISWHSHLLGDGFIFKVK